MFIEEKNGCTNRKHNFFNAILCGKIKYFNLHLLLFDKSISISMKNKRFFRLLLLDYTLI